MTFIYSSRFNFNTPNVSFHANPSVVTAHSVFSKDNFVTNPLSDGFNKNIIEASAKENPRIKELLAEHNLQVKVNDTELEKLKHGHLQDTRILAAKMYSSLPEELKKEVDLPALQEAAMLHDYGKILIPESVLNKQGELNDKEWDIMHMHSELGYELLKDKNINKRALELIKYHHQTSNGNGYPNINSKYNYGIDSQILNAADRYSALTEDRSYKPALGKEEALKIIETDVGENISPAVYNALIKSV